MKNTDPKIAMTKDTKDTKKFDLSLLSDAETADMTVEHPSTGDPILDIPGKFATLD